MNDLTNDSSSWFIIYVRPQQKISRLIATLAEDIYKSCISQIVAPTQTTTKWVGVKKKESKTYAMGSYIFVKSNGELDLHKQKIEIEVGCKITIWPWDKGEDEIIAIQNTFNDPNAVTSEIKPGAYVRLIGEGYKQLELRNVQVQEVNGSSVKVRVWIMKGCDPVDLDVNINDIAPSNNAWEESI